MEKNFGIITLMFTFLTKTVGAKIIDLTYLQLVNKLHVLVS